jgi:hypothetical protein
VIRRWQLEVQLQGHRGGGDLEEEPERRRSRGGTDGQVLPTAAHIRGRLGASHSKGGYLL